MFKRFLQALSFASFFPTVHEETYDPLEPWHKQKLELKGTFRTDINDRKTRLGTNYSSVSLVDLASEQLGGNFKP